MFQAILRALFSTAEQREFARSLRQPIPEPSPAPKPKRRYVIRRVQDRVYEIYDDRGYVGDIFRVDGDEEHDTFWEATVYGVGYSWFKNMNAVKDWLGVAKKV